MKPKLAKPSVAEVNHYLEKWRQSHYALQDKAIRELLLAFPDNQSLNAVLLKASVINNFYSTNIFGVKAMAEHIVAIENLDERLKNGDETLIATMQEVKFKVDDEEKTKIFYSFATKYCCEHNPEGFVIYDSFVDKVLYEMNKIYPFAQFKRTELKDYKKFKSVLSKFQQAFHLTQFSSREIDRYLWLLGKDVFPRKRKRK
ncbi:MAG: hypothetical protein Q4E16_04180 [Neisseria sp.]|nr:hypothetical protein [Neisseria sp.]